jgi:hypothetical protein
MVERLNLTLKDELEALKTGAPVGDSIPKKTSKSTPKRKTPAKAGGEADADGSPKKRGRKKKTDVEAPVKTEVSNGEEEI